MTIFHQTPLRILSLTMFVFVSVMMIWQSGCKKSDSPTQPLGNDRGTVTAVGTPVGSPSTATIGAGGGSLVSPDGRVDIVIPPNALNASTPISIQPVTNEAPDGDGVGFALTPAGQTFSQPVTLRFHYTPIDISGSTLEVLGVATQKDDNIWYSFDKTTLDAAAGTLSITTTHFSLYSLYSKFRITPESAEIPVNGTQQLRVATVAKAADDADPNDDLSPLGPLVTYSNGNEVSWTINGNALGASDDGIVQPSKNSSSTTYRAPSTTELMSSNPAAVTAEVNTPGASKLYLISNVTVLGGGNVCDVTVDFVGTKLGVNSDFSYDYSDKASFVVTTYTNADSVHVSAISNQNGKIGNTRSTNVVCTYTPLDQGNLLNIENVTGLLLRQPGKSDRLSLYIQSTRKGFAYSTDCGSGSRTTPGTSSPVTYSTLVFDLDGSPKTLTIAGLPPNEVVTVQITPRK